MDVVMLAYIEGGQGTEAGKAQSLEPADDVYEPDSEIEASSDEEEPDDAATLPQPRPRTRKRSAGASSGTQPPAAAPSIPLTLDTAVGRRALVPAGMWPTYTCTERDSAGWEVEVAVVDKRANAVLVSFAVARDASGKRWVREWLTFESFQPL